MSACELCNGSGFELIGGRVTGTCRGCKGSGCPRLGRLICTREGHPHGHTYDGSNWPDGHDRSEDAAERTRG